MNVGSLNVIIGVDLLFLASLDIQRKQKVLVLVAKLSQ